MSIRHGLLALLDSGPRYGYQLRTEFEARTGSAWPLNVGQVYTTLGRLERDGLVAAAGEDEVGHSLYAVTEAGRAELKSWFGTPAGPVGSPRDELAIKLAMAATTPGVDVREVVRAQRRRTAETVRERVRSRDEALAAPVPGGAADPEGTARLLVMERLVLRAEAEMRWLDRCEDLLAGRGG
ncbi:PadR family transcriptional regulator [Streptomyces thermolineatus]|uniref:PadR family transcriptional regulator n=1 Tax=Streptomyces thermolineatus TaxID=44033 RepID=UPI00384D14FD